MAGMEPNEAQRLHYLEDENSRLKRLVADLSLDREILKALLTKKRIRSRRATRRCGVPDGAVRRKSAQSLRAGQHRTLEFSLSSKHGERRHAKREVDTVGARQTTVWLSPSSHSPAQRGAIVNHKRVFRVYRAAGLSVKRKKRKRLMRIGQPAFTASPAQPTMGYRLRTRSHGQRQNDTGAECRGHVHTGMPGLGSGNLFTQPARHPSTRPCDRHARTSRSGPEWTMAANLPLVIFGVGNRSTD